MANCDVMRTLWQKLNRKEGGSFLEHDGSYSHATRNKSLRHPYLSRYVTNFDNSFIMISHFPLTFNLAMHLEIFSLAKFNAKKTVPLLRTS